MKLLVNQKNIHFLLITAIADKVDVSIYYCTNIRLVNMIKQE